MVDMISLVVHRSKKHTIASWINPIVSKNTDLCGKIIEHMNSTGEWWEFFPSEISPFDMMKQ